MSEYKQPQIYYLTSENLKDRVLFDYICDNMQNNYYWSDDWSGEFYIELAQAGFISTSYDTKSGLVLLPELQFDYAVLDFKDLHISRKVQKLINEDKYIFCLNSRFDEVIEKISTSYSDNWLKNEYADVLKNLYLSNEKRENFKVVTVEIICKDSNELIAGEIGYIIGKTYTSLSGFSSKQKRYKNYGSLQLVLLAQYLQNCGFSFWNLGHPHMEYKKKLGAKIYSRGDFLKRWNEAVGSPIKYEF